MDARTFKYILVGLLAFGFVGLVCIIGVFMIPVGQGLQIVSSPAAEVGWVIHPESDKIPMWPAPIANAGDPTYINYGYRVEVLDWVDNEHGHFCHAQFRGKPGYIESQYVADNQPPLPTPTLPPTLTPTLTRTPRPTRIPKPTRTPKPTNTLQPQVPPAVARYADKISPLLIGLNVSISAISEASANYGYGLSTYSELGASLVIWGGMTLAYCDQLQAITPPAEVAHLHRGLIDAINDYEAAIKLLAEGYDNYDPDAMFQASDMINRANRKLELARKDWEAYAAQFGISY